MTVGKRLWFGFLAVLIIMALMGSASFWALSTLDREYKELINDRIQKVMLLEQLNAIQSQKSNEIRGYMIFDQISYLESRETLIKEFKEKSETLEKMLRTKKNKEQLADILSSSTSYDELTDKAIKSYQIESKERGVEVSSQASLYQDVMTGQISELITAQEKARGKAEKDLEKSIQTVKLLIIGMAVLAVVAGIVIARVISRMIARPVGKMTEAFQQIASGDLAAQPVMVKNKDEIGDMAAAFNGMSSNLRSVITHVQDSAHQLAAQAEQLSAGAEESLAASETVASISKQSLQASTDQQSLVSESNVAISEVLNTVDTISSDNEEMLRSSEQVTKLVQEGSTSLMTFSTKMSSISSLMKNSSQTITEMAEHSENIRGVTSMITGLADQTNLLALNAAIEAARAGEHGKGFAVVAEEVRNLAEQSKRSSAEIDQLIAVMIENVKHAVEQTEVSANQMQEGLVVTSRTSEVFQEIELAASDVDERVSKVSSSIEIMKSMIQNVVDHATSIESLAQQAADEAESARASSEEQLAVNEEISTSAQLLAELAEKLQKNMNQFTV
ncbi:methyl-accepting chemotaxis protein [Sporosarcina sp. ZBG7A]|uniref:methyl-accepting chemotaxis protein n=1 Tax=Sporosarcina sp. ZBG7A TaxID=1582223 RepID=UPI001E44F378|nr:methyl-accepting chemotaxis protein [Sporosarcina sp. ZBG7A]